MAHNPLISDEVTCLLCADRGGHTTRQHYSTAPRAAHPTLIKGAMDRIERETGKRPTLASIMEACGVAKRLGA